MNTGVTAVGLLGQPATALILGRGEDRLLILTPTVKNILGGRIQVRCRHHVWKRRRFRHHKKSIGGGRGPVCCQAYCHCLPLECQSTIEKKSVDCTLSVDNFKRTRGTGKSWSKA